MLGQAGRLLVGSQKRDATNATGGIDSTTNETIQIIEAFLGASSVSPRVRGAWKRVRNAVGKPARGLGLEKGEQKEEALEGITPPDDSSARVRRPHYTRGEKGDTWRGS